jgi:hypothetical protein
MSETTPQVPVQEIAVPEAEAPAPEETPASEPTAEPAAETPAEETKEERVISFFLGSGHPLT